MAKYLWKKKIQEVYDCQEKGRKGKKERKEREGKGKFLVMEKKK